MYGINEILRKNFFKKPLTDAEKFEILHSKKIDIRVVIYLMKKLQYLQIEVLGKYDGNLFDLMNSGKLMGWCWQTTESEIVFLDDDDYIERGYLYFDERYAKYYHSWICFNYNGIEYVFDPCLNLLCKKKDYSKMFETDVKGKVFAKEVKEELVRQIISSTEDKEQNRNEVIAHGPEDVNTPLYRNGAGYKTELKNGKIKKMTVRYYYIEG